MIALVNGQQLPMRGTMLYVNGSEVKYFTDRELTNRFVSAARPGYQIRTAPVNGFEVGVFTGNYHAVNDQLVSVQVQHISPLNQAGEFVPTTVTNWIQPNVKYDPEKQGVLPAEYKIQNGQLAYDYTAYQVTDLSDKARAKRNILTLLGIAILIYFLSKK